MGGRERAKKSFVTVVSFVFEKNLVLRGKNENVSQNKTLEKSVLQYSHIIVHVIPLRCAADSQSAAFLFVIIQSSSALSKSLKSGLM